MEWYAVALLVLLVMGIREVVHDALQVKED